MINRNIFYRKGHICPPLPLNKKQEITLTNKALITVRIKFNPYQSQITGIVTAPSKAWVCGRSFAGIVGSNPAGDLDICPL